MADARSVALIVHGVGDHTHSNILDALDLGLQRSLPSGTFESDRLTLSKVFLPSGTLGNVEVTRIKTSKRESFVIPVVWSREHLRAEPQIKYHIFRIGSSVQWLQILVMKVARPLFELCLNAFCCVSKGTGTIWRLALAAVAVLISALVIGATVGLWLCLAFLPYILRPYTGGFRTWPYIVAVTIIPAMVIALFRKLMPLLDLVGDIVSCRSAETAT